jgi:hypothetical protein
MRRMLRTHGPSHPRRTRTRLEHRPGRGTLRDAEAAYGRGGPGASPQRRHEDLAWRDLAAQSKKRLQAGGEYDAERDLSRYQREPMTVAEHLELIATGEHLARRYSHPSMVHRAVQAGATWQQVADAAGTDERTARERYVAWSDGQHVLHADFPQFGLDDTEYAAAMERAAGTAGRDLQPGEPGYGAAYAATHPVLCAHEDQNGQGAHWLEPGERWSGAWPPEVTADTDREAGR